MKPGTVIILLVIAVAWHTSGAQADARVTGQSAASTAVTEAAVLITNARAVSSKKLKPGKQASKRFSKKRKRKLVGARQRARAAMAVATHQVQSRKCKGRKRWRRCRAHSPLDDAYVPPAAIATHTPMTTPSADSVGDHRPPISINVLPDIVEREDDVPLIIQIALTLAGNRLEQALTLVEAHDAATGQRAYRIVPGDEAKRTPDEAELPDIILQPNERIVADIHSHPEVKAAGRTATDKVLAARATQANLYPGISDFAAIEKRRAVSAILNPNGTVFLLRRISGAPSIRVVEGAALTPLAQRHARRLDLNYLYDQGYLADGAWTDRATEPAAHASARAGGAETGGFVTTAP